MMKERHIYVCKSTALTRVLYFVDVFMLRIPLHDTYYPLLPGLFWIWEIRYSLKAEFLASQINKLQAITSHFAEKLCTSSFMRPTVFNLFHYYLSSEEFSLHVEDAVEQSDLKQIVFCIAWLFTSD